MRFWIRTGAFATVILLTVMLTLVSAPAPPSTPPSTNQPVSMANYGVTDVFGSTAMTGGITNIQIYTNGNSAPFFVLKVLLYLLTPGQSDIILQSVSLNGVQSWSYASYNNQPRVVIVPQGTTLGDIISVLPSSLSLLLVKDPLSQSQAIAGFGGTNGLTFGIGYAVPLVGGQVAVMALVVAPTNSTVTLNIS